jgi:hypothetical protein
VSAEGAERGRRFAGGGHGGCWGRHGRISGARARGGGAGGGRFLDFLLLPCLDFGRLSAVFSRDGFCSFFYHRTRIGL